MLSFIGKRFMQLIPTVFGVILVTFLILQLIPGDPTVMLGGQTISDEVRAQLRAKWHLDEPMLVQLGYYMKGIATGDLGESMRYGVPVLQKISEHFVRTFQLGVVAFFLSVTLGLAMGIIAALTKGTWIDRAVLAVALVGISTPVFVVGIGLIILAAAVNYTYFSGTGEGDGIDFRYMILPAVTLGSRSIAYLSRMTRSAILEVGESDFLRTARAKGLSERVVVFKHQMRNAMIPITTVIGLNFADYLTGAILTETVFQWPGIGFLVRRAIEFRDLPLIMGTVLFVTLLFVAINFVVDVLYGFFDPRIRVS